MRGVLFECTENYYGDNVTNWAADYNQDGMIDVDEYQRSTGMVYPMAEAHYNWMSSSMPTAGETPSFEHIREQEMWLMTIIGKWYEVAE